MSLRYRLRCASALCYVLRRRRVGGRGMSVKHITAVLGEAGRFAGLHRAGRFVSRKYTNSPVICRKRTGHPLATAFCMLRYDVAI